MRYRGIYRDEGMVLVLALFLVFIAVMTLGALSIRVVNQSRQADQFVDYEECMYGIESGLARSRVSLEEGNGGMVGVTPRTDAEGAPLRYDFGDDGVFPLVLSEPSGVEYFAYAENWGNDRTDNNGDGAVDGPEEQGFYTVFSVARKGVMTRQVEVVLEGTDVNVWNNAIFAGAGGANGAIQGNCSIHGSVHILGNHIPLGGEAVVVLDMMGASLIHNNYGSGPGPGPTLPDYLRTRVPTPPRANFEGESDLETLNARLRVKRGLISLNSASEVGTVQTLGNGLKETVDGVFNTDGWTGQRTQDDGDRGDPTVVYSDNGWDELYDLGDKVKFPTLDDDWRWPSRVECYELGQPFTGIPGGTEKDVNGDVYSHSAFFSDQLSDGNAYSGDVTIQTNKDFYLNLSKPGSTVAQRTKPDPANCIKGDDYIYYNSATKVLEVNGQIEIDGNLVLTTRNGNTDKTIYYTGRAAFLVRGDVTLNTDLLTCNNGNPSDYAQSFPERNIIGIMAQNNMLMGEHAQLDLLGAFYAQGTVTSKKQTVVMGTFVSNFFDMGSQVPDIYQVPALAKNLPLGMIGNWPIFALSEVSWRELRTS